jgi:hypothetical protein
MGEEAMRHAEKVLDELWPDLCATTSFIRSPTARRRSRA